MAVTAAFVTDARAHYVPAIRWLRANGYAWAGAFRNKEKRLSIEWSTGGDSDFARPYLTVNTRTEHGSLLRCPLMADVDSCRQAVDYLVTAGVLPIKFHSLTEHTAVAIAGQIEVKAQQIRDTAEVTATGLAIGAIVDEVAGIARDYAAKEG